MQTKKSFNTNQKTNLSLTKAPCQINNIHYVSKTSNSINYLPTTVLEEEIQQLQSPENISDNDEYLTSSNTFSSSNVSSSLPMIREEKIEMCDRKKLKPNLFTNENESNFIFSHAENFVKRDDPDREKQAAEKGDLSKTIHFSPDAEYAELKPLKSNVQEKELSIHWKDGPDLEEGILMDDSEEFDGMEENIETTKASFLVTAFGIGKHITGSGIIAMPQIVVFASFVPSILMTLFICYLSMYSFYLLGKCCELSNSKTFQELWHKAYDGKYVWVCQMVLIGQTFFGAVSYVKCFGDFGGYLLQLIPSISGTIWASKTAAMLYTHGILQFLILPKDLSSLQYTSIIGLFAVSYLVLYTIIIGCKYLCGYHSPEMEDVLMQESFVDNIWVFRWSWLAPASTLSSSFICHYNAPKFFAEMKEKKKFKKATQYGFLIALIPHMLVMIFGYLALQNFMSHTPQNLQNSGNIITLFGYQEAEGHSPFLIICASLYMLNVIFSYPFIFMSLRDSFLQIIFPKGYGETKRLILTEIIFITVCLFSLIPVPIDDTIRWKGAFFAPFILCVFPAIFYNKLIPEEKKTKSEKIGIKVIFIFGLFQFLTSSIYCIVKCCGINLYYK